jgi:hypothetical protein
MRPLTEGEKKNAETLERAYANGDVATVNTVLAVDIPAGTEVAVIVAMGRDDDEVTFTPFAMQFPGNPYEMLVDPTEDVR